MQIYSTRQMPWGLPYWHWGMCTTDYLQSNIASVLSLDILDTTGSQQLCAGHTSACEAAVHAARSIFRDPATEAFLMVDATS